MAYSRDRIFNKDCLLPDRPTLINACETALIEHDWKTNHIVWPTGQDVPSYYIKFGPHIGFEEALNQRYFFEKINPRSKTRIPEIVWAFEDRVCMMTFIVATYIKHDGYALQSDKAAALIDLMGVPPPKEAPPGPIGGGLMRHRFFKHETAPREFQSIAELDKDINKMLKRMGHDKSVQLVNQPCCMYFTDLVDDNFLKGEDGLTWIVDFYEAGVGPIAFMALTLVTRYPKLAQEVTAGVPALTAVDSGTIQCLGIAQSGYGGGGC